MKAGFAERDAFVALPEGDPHKLPARKKTIREIQRELQPSLLDLDAPKALPLEDERVEGADKVARRYGGSEL